MDAEQVRDLMRQLGDGVGRRGVALRCDCENLETVYVAVDKDGTVRVSDDHSTFQYLDNGADSTYVPVESLDLAAVAQVCRGLGVELRSAPPDGYPSIECVPKPGEPVSEAVERMAEAIDRVFALAMGPELK
jgi:hypothetical protein